jgi:hypothetical protein
MKFIQYYSFIHYRSPSYRLSLANQGGGGGGRII